MHVGVLAAELVDDLLRRAERGERLDLEDREVLDVVHALVGELVEERFEDRSRGVAVHESFGSVVAQVAEVVKQDGRPRVKRIVCVIDCGTVVNPGIVTRQVESGIVFGLTAALWGRIDIVDGEVRQKNFPDQPLLTLAQCPAIETHLMPSDAPPAGVGEPATPLVAPAVANAWFALTGERRRSLPLALGTGQA